MGYSQWGVLKDELEGEASSRLLGKLWHKAKQSESLILDIYVPVDAYVRGKSFCEDIEALGEGFGKFNINVLLNLLYNDWLMFARRTNESAVYNHLASLEPVSRKKKKDVYFYNIEESKAVKKLHTGIRRRHLLRGEIMLNDLEKSYPKHGYTIERIIELLFKDFMKKSGVEVVKHVLKLISD